MRSLYINFFFFVFIIFCPRQILAKNSPDVTSRSLYFIENKGQITDQYNNPRKDIQYSLQGQGVTVFIGEGQLHYQFSHRDHCGPEQLKKNKKTFHRDDTPGNDPAEIQTYRMDVELAGANKNAEVITEEMQAYYENYFVSGCSEKGIQTKTCRKITYKDILPDIDWVIYIKNGKLEHEFVVRPGGDASNIKLQYNGQTCLEMNADGSLTATTPMGVIKELAPVCYLSNDHVTNIRYRLNGNVLSYEIGQHEQSYVIDPILEWGTYYGPDTSSSPLYSVTCDESGNVYASGLTYAGTGADIATVGSYQYTYGGNEDAYLVKFDSSGNRLWATYYGGGGLDIGYSVCCDHSGNVYMGGITSSTSNISTPGSQQNAIGGSGALNGFVAKFDSAGNRIWATYYGGDQMDEIHTVMCDLFNNVYVVGSASSTFNIATPGSFEPIFTNPGFQHNAGFIAKFDSTGARQWGTYYCGYVGAITTDMDGVRGATDGYNVYVAGFTDATDSLTTPGCWQPVYGGNTDDFVAKFDNLGNRVWGTYYGGEQEDLTGSIACKDVQLYLFGGTRSTTGIASAGSYQQTIGGGQDAFLVEFNPGTGMRNWGTYYGGPLDENVLTNKICIGAGGVYITGYTVSTSGIASAGAWQTTYGGGTNDGFLAEYDPTGMQLWSTYYGGNNNDEAFACAFDGQNVYVCGETNSPDRIATPGSFKSVYSGGSTYTSGFLAKFSYLIPGPIIGPDSVCIGNATTLSDNLSGGSWSSSNTTIAIVDSSSGIVTGISAGVTTITYFSSTGNFVTMQDTIKACIDNVTVISTDKNKPQIFPNPATDYLTVTSADEITNVTITDILGETVYTHSYDSRQAKIYVSDLPSGVYIIKIRYSSYHSYLQNNSSEITQKFVKE